jgi:hypothetical protein
MPAHADTRREEIGLTVAVGSRSDAFEVDTRYFAERG